MSIHTVNVQDTALINCNAVKSGSGTQWSELCTFTGRSMRHNTQSCKAQPQQHSPPACSTNESTAHYSTEPGGHQAPYNSKSTQVHKEHHQPCLLWQDQAGPYQSQPCGLLKQARASHGCSSHLCHLGKQRRHQLLILLVDFLAQSRPPHFCLCRQSAQRPSLPET
jgi:hypothetical protein